MGAAEQRRRLQTRIDDPDKRWKFDPGDLEDRKHWEDFMRAYEDALAATSTTWAPWYVVPADSKTHRNLMVAEILLQVLEGMKPEYPEGNPAFEALKIE